MLEINHLHIDKVIYKKDDKYIMYDLETNKCGQYWDTIKKCISFTTRYETTPEQLEEFKTLEIVDLLQYTWTARYMKSIVTKKLIDFVV